MTDTFSELKHCFLEATTQYDDFKAGSKKASVKCRAELQKIVKMCQGLRTQILLDGKGEVKEKLPETETVVETSPVETVVETLPIDVVVEKPKKKRSSKKS